MKKFVFIFMILSVSFFATVAFAEDQEMEPGMDMREGKGMMGKMGGKGKGMHQQPSMLATSDGGVLVLTGGKLAKYDSNLNLVKEVEVKGGPTPDKMKWKEMSREGSGSQPMNDAEVAAMLDQEPPAQAHDALDPAPGE